MFDGDRLSLTLPTAQTIDLAPWHRGREHLVANALSEASSRAPNLDHLARLVLPRAPRKTLASSTLKTADACSGLVLLDDAVRAEHIGIRTVSHAYAVAADCDHADWAELLDEMEGHGLPRPTWIAADPWTGRAHLVWWLRDAVVLTEPGREAPRRLLDAVARLLTAAVRGDPAYTGTLTKNPWAPGPAFTRSGLPAVPAMWDAHQASSRDLRNAVVPCPALHDLRVLRRALQAWQDATGAHVPGRRRRATTVQDSERGRRLFDGLRHRVYAAWPVSQAEVQAMASETAAALGSPISPRQLAGMARRMHTWCSRHYTARRTAAGKDIDRGRDRLETSGLDLSEKQAIAARRTASATRAATVARLREAADGIIASGAPLTRASLAAAADMSQRTVQRCWNTVQQGGDRRCPSGKAAAAAPGAAGPQLSSNQNPSSSLPFLAEVARRDRGVRRILRTLAKTALDASRPGANPPSLPMVDLEFAAVPAVHIARRDAEAAVADARRRAAARVDRQAAAARSVEMRTQAKDRAAGWRWFHAQLADLDLEWDAREAAANLRELPYIRNRRVAVVIGRWRSWKATLRHNRPEPADEEIPW